MDVILRAYNILLILAIVILAVLILLSVIRSVLGPHIADRIIAVNMVGTMIISIISILSVYYAESYLEDISLIYAMLSFLAVVVLCRVYTGVYLEHRHHKADMDAITKNVSAQAEEVEEFNEQEM